MKYQYHKDGTAPPEACDKTIFVFGSNLSGIHGAGAARAAFENYGAKWGTGVGFAGQSYAIPTKDFGIARTLTIGEISDYVIYFKLAANNVRGMDGNVLKYFVTRIGCGLAGYKDEDIAPLFANSPENCNFPVTWKPFLEVL
jgi:hypothetical protein